MAILGRKKELKILQDLLETPEAEFLALYGRRRVGKTYLIHQFYRDKGLYFELTGLKDANKSLQIKNFVSEYADRFGQPPSSPPKDWTDAFTLLRHQIERSTQRHVIIFFDELPWLASPRSGFLQALDHLWNRYLSRDPRVILIVCGSAASWMIKKIIHNRGGLYGRLTKQIRLLPYSLRETEEYLQAKRLNLDRKEIAELYMTTGGIPKYLNEVRPGESTAQIIQHLFFDADSPLVSEFRRLYESLFDGAEKHVALVRLLAQHRNGLTQSQIVERLPDLSSGGTFSNLLTELAESGFIALIPQYGQRKKNARYLLIDEYSLFYLTWIEPVMGLGTQSFCSEYWMRQHGSQSYRSWAGYAFEALCLKHVRQIIRALELGVVATSYGGWRKASAQIDLIIDRADRAVSLCEIKFSADEYSMTKRDAEQLNRKKRIFREHLKSHKALFTTLIAANGAKRNQHFLRSVHNLVTLDDLYI